MTKGLKQGIFLFVIVTSTVAGIVKDQVPSRGPSIRHSCIQYNDNCLSSDAWARTLNGRSIAALFPP